MRRAIISDVEGNLESLEAVLADIATQGVDETYCLGLVGYGPNPRECIDLVMKHCKVCLRGGVDSLVLVDPICAFNSIQESVTRWTREQLRAVMPPGESARNLDEVYAEIYAQPKENHRALVANIKEVRLQPAADAPPEAVRRWEFLARLQPSHGEDTDLLYVHGSARRPESEYVFPEDVYNTKKIEAIVARVKQYCFQGHTHSPGVFVGTRAFYSPREVGGEYELTGEKTMVNVGSVGQPRDGDTRACYVIYDDHAGRRSPTIAFRRVGYDIETTLAKIRAIPELRYTDDRLRQAK